MAKKQLIKTSTKNNARNKLIAIITLITILPVIGLGYFTYKNAFEILEEKLEVTTKQTVEETNNAITRFLEGLENQAEVLGNDSIWALMLHELETKDKAQPENIDGKIETSQINTNDLMTNGISYKDKALEQLRLTKESSKDIKSTYFATSEGEMYLYPKEELSEGYDPRSRSWYKDAINNQGNISWSDPYLDDNAKRTTVTVAKAVKDKGKVIGVVGIDIQLDELSEALANRTIGRQGYVFVADKNGIIIAHRNKDLLGTDTRTKKGFWETVNSGANGFVLYDHEGEDKFLSYTTNDITGWKLMASMEQSELRTDTNTILKSTVLISILAWILATLAAILIASKATQPLNMLMKAFANAANGDLTTRVNIKSKDEFGQMGKNFNLMLEGINNLIKDIKVSSQTVLGTSESLGEITAQTTEATREVARTIEEIAGSTNSQAKDTENGAVKINEIAERIESVSSTADYMNDISNETNSLTNKGLEIVKTLTEKSSKTASATGRVNEIVVNVDKSALDIGAISDTISKIAEQTNLLALNAAIEAARAGEHGKGFAVVADEVRKLAEESSNATNEIKQLITSIQNQSKAAVQSMDETKVTVGEQDIAVKETEGIFNQILESVKALIEKVEEINDSSAEMSNQKDTIVDIIGNISAVSEQNSAATQEVSASTEEQLASIEEVEAHTQNLKELSKNLESAINKFSVN